MGAPAVPSPQAVSVLLVVQSPEKAAALSSAANGLERRRGPGQLLAGGGHKQSMQKAWLKSSHSLQWGGLSIPGAPGPASRGVSVSILLV